MDKTTIHMVPEPRKKELVNATYGIIGCMQQGHNQLGPGVPEYIYQEALAMELAANGFTAHKDLQFYPTFRGKPMDAYIKMDMVVESSVGNDIIECKELTQLTEREHYQTFGYLRATDWPIAILVNFGASPRTQIERFYNDNNTIVVF